MSEPDVSDLGVGGGDRLQPIVVVIPCYVNVPTRFMTNVLAIAAEYPGPLAFHVMQGVYVDQSMRHAVLELLEHPEWERLVVLEQDMILQRDALVKHALHTDDIVGSVYFQHAPPHQINCMFRDPRGGERWGHPTPDTVRAMLAKPALWKCDVVGLGLTSIARRVFEQWPDDVPMFLTGYKHADRLDPFTHGCMSHDVHFCIEARKLGFEVYLDTSIRCQHLTEGWTDVNHYLNANREPELHSDRIVLPFRQANTGRHVPDLRKAVRTA